MLPLSTLMSQGTSKFRNGEEDMLLTHHPVFKETSFTTKTLFVFDGNAKSTNCLQHHNNESYLWTDFHCTDMDTGSIRQMEGICGQ